MGRHSVPDDDSDDPADGGGVLVDDQLFAGAGAGRHSRAADSPEPIDINGPVETDGPSESSGAALAEAGPEASLFDILDIEDAPRDPAPGPAAPAFAPEPPKPPKDRRHSTRADFALIKNHGDVRARCLAALVVPFVVCVAVLVAVGASGRTFLIWIAVTIFVAGVLVGVCLDAGHKRYPPPG